MLSPLISIIIPTFNRAAILPQAIDSVIAQTYELWECLVVDDGSTDTTLEILKEYQRRDSRIKYYQRERLPKGAPTCRNIGLAHAQGDHVIFLDSDDYLLPHCLEQRVKKINEYPDCDFLVFPMGEQRNDEIKKKNIPIYDDYLIPFLSANLPWQTMCPIWKKEFIKELEGFKEGYPRFNDPELMIRALLRPKVEYKVLYDLNYDSVYLPSLKHDVIFIDKIYKSLILLIPDICKELKAINKVNFKKYLVYYLHYWFRYIYKPKHIFDLKKSIILIKLFKNLRIISFSKAISLVLRLVLYSTSSYVFSTPINKLKDKGLYV